MLENVPVRIGKFYIPTDFVIMDIKEDSHIPIILGEPAIDEPCCFLDVIDKCVKEMEKESFKYTEVLKIPTPPIFEDHDWNESYVDDILRTCRALTPNPMPWPEKPSIELKSLPKDLRYEFLDTKLERLFIVNADLG